MGTPLRVLIVEDSEEDTLLIVRELKRGGFDLIHERVETAESMKAALSTKTWDLILADYSMPHFSGLEALKLLKASGLGLPFIIVSGSIGEDVAVEAMKAGAQDYLMKNNLTRLVPAIQQELREAEVRRKLKVSQNALQESEKRYRQVVENATEIIYAIDDKGNFTYGNPAGLKVAGYSLQELRGLNYTDLVVPDHRERVSQAYINQFRERRPTSYIEFPFFNKSGEIIWFGQNTSLVIEDGRVVGFQIIARGITERKKVEQALSESEQRYRNLVENAPDVIYALAPDGTTTSLNPAFERITGWSRSEWLNKQFASILHPDDLSRGLEFLQRALKGEKIATFELRVLRKSGDYLVAEFTVTPQTQNGSVIGVLGIARDITERKRAEEALRESEERYRTILDNIEDGYFEVDIAGNFTFFNDSLCIILGYSRDEMMGMNNRQYMDKENAQKVYQTFNQVYTTGKPQISFDWEIIRKDCIKRFIESSVSLIRNSKSEQIGFRGVVRDVTDRKQAEEALRKSEQRFRELYDNAPVGYFEYDTQGRITNINRTELEMLGYTLDEMIGQPVWKFIVEKGEARQQILAKLAGTIPPARGLERTYRRKDGTTFSGIVEDRLILDSKGKIKGIRAIIQDITERKQAEDKMIALQDQLRQSQKMEAIGGLAGGIAHDFNNLLTVIKGYSQLSLTEMKEGEPLRENIEEIKKSADRAADLTRQLLAFSRRQVMEMKVMDLNDLLRNLGKMLHRVISEDIELATILEENLGRVKTDPGQIEQVIMNLAVNARDAMSKGGKLTIETANVDLDQAYARAHVAVKPGPYVMISVSDTGVGMTPEVRDRVFEPFFTTKEKGKGTGLGLSTVYGIVKQSGGNIWVYSEPGKGTEFKIYLPRVDEPLEELKEKVEKEGLPRGNERILIVEDEEDVLKLAGRILRRQGYEVLEAINGGEVLKICRGEKKPIHLILTDVVMPQISGRELIKRCQEVRQDFKVIYMSGYTDDIITHHGVLQKGLDYIQKPFTVDELARKVRRVLDK